MKLKPIGPNNNEVTLTNGAKVLFSYETPVAYRGPLGTFQTAKKWSRTTARHVNKWLDGDTAIYREQSFFDCLMA